MSKGWYVLHVYSGYEKKVEEAVNKLIDEKVLDGILYQIKVPMRDVAEMKNGKKKILKKKVFPGYVLVEVDIDKRRWKEIYSVIKSINGVTGFVGADK
ncbi:MAG TPA: transcription termination/antitermination NusG family protein, partial [Spirochaetota bacterium]|nr:transcription termination/antitermination NusG family protein [Spirochaetota bacterium]